MSRRSLKKSSRSSRVPMIVPNTSIFPFGSKILHVLRMRSVIQLSSCWSWKAEIAAGSQMRRPAELTSSHAPRVSPAFSAARSRHSKKRSTSLGLKKYCPSSEYQKPKPSDFLASASACFHVLHSRGRDVGDGTSTLEGCQRVALFCPAPCIVFFRQTAEK